MENDFISTKKLCEILGVTRETIHYWRKRGMPYHQYGTRTFRYKMEEIEAWQEKIKKEKQ
ncbi:MAG: helix-turn-helix domain-containing protein [Candidatus Paceibacterota bacterium]